MNSHTTKWNVSSLLVTVPELVGHSAGGCGSPGIRLPQGHPEQSYIAHCLFWG